MARLTTERRKELPKKDFAVPSRGEGKAKRGGYPIPDKSHARNALARASQFGTPKVKAEVRSAVERKFPGIAVGGKKSERKEKRR
jgi:hypothetical protein